MAYSTLRSGSRGEDVKKLQQQLINAGYNVGSTGADGIYGKNTAAAVTQYQKDKGLSVDGIAGNQTLTSLYETGASQQAAPAAPAAPAQTESPVKGVSQEVYDKMTETYKESENVANAWATMEELKQSLKGGTKYGDDLDAIVDKLMNRPAFSYNVEEDPLFQQMLASQKTAGEKAMEDTVARSSALTGGYGNSWAQTAGQQAFDQYLQGAYDQLPQYYQLALNAYNMESDELARQYSMLSDLDQKEFDRLITEIGLAADDYDRLYAQDRTGYEDRVGMAQQLAAMMSSDYWNKQSADFQKEQFEYQKEQDRIANQLAAARAYSSASESSDNEYDTLMSNYLDGIKAAEKRAKSDQELAKYLQGAIGDLDTISQKMLLDQAGLGMEAMYSKEDAFAEIDALANNKNISYQNRALEKAAILERYKNTSFYNDLVQRFRYYRF